MSVSRIPLERKVESASSSPARTSPRSPLNLSELSSSSASENSSLTDVVSTRHDLEAKLVAANQTKQMYRERVTSLENEIRELNAKADLTLQILDDRKETLLRANDALQEELDGLPPIDYLEEQLQMLGVPLNERKIIEQEEREPFPTEELVRLGVLHPGESPHHLPRRIDEMISALKPQPRTNGVAIIGDGSRTTEAELKKRIDLQRVMASRNERAQFEINMLNADVTRLRRRERDLQESSASGSASMSPRASGSLSPRPPSGSRSARAASGSFSAKASPRPVEKERDRDRQRQSLPLSFRVRD